MKIRDITKDEILEWLSEHEQAFDDFMNHFDIDEDDPFIKGDDNDDR